MDASELVAALAELGVSLHTDGESLRYSPTGLPANVLADMRANKAEIIQILVKSKMDSLAELRQRMAAMASPASNEVPQGVIFASGYVAQMMNICKPTITENLPDGDRACITLNPSAQVDASVNAACDVLYNYFDKLAKDINRIPLARGTAFRAGLSPGGPPRPGILHQPESES